MLYDALLFSVQQMAMIEKNVANCYVWDWEKVCMPIDGEKYTIKGCIRAYFTSDQIKLVVLLTKISSFYVLQW
jgi:hypothetical protein